MDIVSYQKNISETDQGGWIISCPCLDYLGKKQRNLFILLKILIFNKILATYYLSFP